MEAIQIKKISISDLEAIKKLSIQTFHETFAAVNTEANMKMYLQQSFSSERLSIELNDPFAEWYFVIFDDTPIGYLKINFGPSQTELKDNNTVEIERIYVLKEFHGKRVGQILYDTACNVARDKNAEYLWLGVWENNQRAIGFYKKLGFIAFDQHKFMLGDDEQTDIMMKLKI